MGALRRTGPIFVACFLAAIILAACGNEAKEGSRLHAVHRSLGIPALEGVKSGEVEVALSSRGGAAQDTFFMRVLGTFLTPPGGTLPEVDFNAEANGEWRGKAVDFGTALIATNDRAVLTYDGETFETDRPTFEMLQASFGKPAGSGSPADPAACLEAVGEIVPSRIVKGPIRPTHNAGVDETRVSTVTAQLRVDRLVGALRQIQANPGCNAQLRAAGSFRDLLAGVRAELERARGAEATVSLDEDGILRELSVHVTPASPGESAGDVEFVVRLGFVNEVTELPPCHGERELGALFRKLGFNPLVPIERGEAEGLIGLLTGIFGRSDRLSRL